MTTQKSSTDAGRTGWREPYFWLVVGGPLTVVIAAIATFFIAASAPDPVLTRTETLRVGSSEDGGKNASREELIKIQPAQQARNHAAAPHVPESSAKKPADD